MTAGRLRWWLWGKLSDRPGVCPANAHSRVIYGERDRSIKVDSMCRRDLSRTGTCYCGKLRQGGAS